MPNGSFPVCVAAVLDSASLCVCLGEGCWAYLPSLISRLNSGHELPIWSPLHCLGASTVLTRELLSGIYALPSTHIGLWYYVKGLVSWARAAVIWSGKPYKFVGEKSNFSLVYISPKINRAALHRPKSVPQVLDSSLALSLYAAWFGPTATSTRTGPSSRTVQRGRADLFPHLPTPSNSALFAKSKQSIYTGRTV